MANLKGVALITTNLWLFYVLCVFCSFGIEKNEISKNLFSKGYFKIVLCTFMTNFKVVYQRMMCVILKLALKVGKIGAAEEQDQDKNYGSVGLKTGGSNIPLTDLEMSPMGSCKNTPPHTRRHLHRQDNVGGESYIYMYM